MSYFVSLEEMEERWIAHVPELWGCFATADDRDKALALVPAAIAHYRDWWQAHGETLTIAEPLTLSVAEMQREVVDPANADNIANAFFATDALPLTAPELDAIRRLLDWSRADLLASVNDLPELLLDQPVEGEWTIDEILNHTARAERWYLDRLGLAFPRADLLPDRFQRLDQVRTRLLTALPSLIGLARIEWVDSELWSPRKMLRRALWHERDHTAHIWQFRARLQA
jgi:predicted RNase H-like HicB family nuclease